MKNEKSLVKRVMPQVDDPQQRDRGKLIQLLEQYVQGRAPLALRPADPPLGQSHQLMPVQGSYMRPLDVSEATQRVLSAPKVYGVW
jgi:hypothetical protein